MVFGCLVDEVVLNLEGGARRSIVVMSSSTFGF